MIRALLKLLLVMGGVAGIFVINLSAAPGLSVQNGLLYLLTLLLVYQFTTGNLKVELGSVQMAFLVLIIYAMVSWTVAAYMIRYPRYGLFGPAAQLKNSLIDPLLLFAVYFYGTRSATEALSVMKVLLFIVLIGNGAMLLDVYGIIDSPAVYSDEGRLEGPFGAPNQHGAFNILILPAAIALRNDKPRDMATRMGNHCTYVCCRIDHGSLEGRNPWACRCVDLWIVLASPIYFNRTCSRVGSRGNSRRDRTCSGTGQRVFCIAFEERFQKTADVDAGAATSGRTAIWGAAIARMFDAPLTLLTGFGWDVYRSMAFKYAPHNHYLGIWFDLGIVGVACTLLIFAKCVGVAREGAGVIESTLRPHLVACVFGLLGLFIALFFTEIHTPWFYIWPYIGLVDAHCGRRSE